MTETMTRILASDFADRILSFENCFSDKARQQFRDNCTKSWDSWTRQSVIVPLGEAKHHLDQKPNNYLYDRKSGLVWINLQGGMHSTMMASLYIFHKGGSSIRDWTMEQADNFVIEGHGMFLSSVGDHSYKGSRMELTRQEKTVFGKQSIRNLDSEFD